jgi:hypothetical protein
MIDDQLNSMMIDDQLNSMMIDDQLNSGGLATRRSLTRTVGCVSSRELGVLNTHETYGLFYLVLAILRFKGHT